MASPIRITGMNSGLDTESIITALTSTQKQKVTKFEGEQKRLSWKQDAWKKLNKKITDFYNGTLSSMRFSDAFSKKTTTVSNPNAVTVTTGANAMNVTQKLKVKEVAASAYQTGGVIQTKNGDAVTSSTKMSDLKYYDNQTKDADGNNNIAIKVGNETKTVTYGADDTIGDVVKKFQAIGVNASFDEGQGRLYISSKETGSAANFEILAAQNGNGVSALGLTMSSNAEKTGAYQKGVDAEIELNGVSYKSKDGNFSVNGLTITANQKTDDYITLTTKNDTSGIYDMVKDFIKGYSELINEMAKLYNADSAKSYKMLTEEERDAMSDDEIEKWEEKIKDGLLSKDSTLGDVSSAMRSIMASTFEVANGKGETVQMNLMNFGINTQSYFNAPADERYAYHIDGDKDSEISSVKNAEDKLGQMITNDPDLVSNFFMALSKSLYGKLTDLMKGSEYSSSYTIYEDKLMNKQYSSYNDKISDANDRLTAMEDRYYKKFSKMETAMAKLNSTQGAISSYFGLG